MTDLGVKKIGLLLQIHEFETARPADFLSFRINFLPLRCETIERIINRIRNRCGYNE